MELVILVFLFFINLVFLILAYFSGGENFFFSICSATLFLILGVILIAEGVDITYYGAYGFVANNTTSMTGIATTTVNRKDVYTGGLGSLFLICSLYMILVPLFERASREHEEGGEVIE